MDGVVNEDVISSFYGLSTLHPEKLEDVWKPSGKNGSGIGWGDDVEKLTTDEQFNELARLVGNSSSLTLDDPNGVGRLGEEDPLGFPRIVDTLISRNVILGRNDPKLKQYLVSSQSFQAQQYLSKVHQESSINDLMRSMSYLEKNIQNQTSELRQVIDSHYLKFADCKKDIDSVLVKFKETKTIAQQERENTKVFNPIRNKKRQSLTLGISSNSIATVPASSGTSTTLGGSGGAFASGSGSLGGALSADLDDGLQNLITTTSLLIKPIIDHKNKEVKLNKLIEFIQQNKFFFDLPNKMIGLLKNHEHELFIEEYHNYLRKREDIQEQSQAEGSQLLVNTALVKTFKEVDSIIEEYRKKTYKELLSIDHEAGGAKSHFRNNTDNAKFISLVDKLYKLNPRSLSDGSTKSNGDETDPIYEFLNLQLDSLKKEFKYQLSKFERKFTMMQRKLLDYLNSLNNDKRDGGSNVSFISEKYSAVEDYIRTTPELSGNGATLNDQVILEIFDTNDNLDISIINETWLVLFNFVNYLDDLFIQKITKFVRNYNHYNNLGNSAFPPVDIDGSIRTNFVKFMVVVTSKLVAIFNDPNSQSTSQYLESSPKMYATFVPHHSNSLSTIYYLTNIGRLINHLLTKIGKSINCLGKGNDTNTIIKNLRNSSNVINQKIIEAVCAVWVNDCTQFYDLENWEMQKLDETKNKNIANVSYTKCISIIQCYEAFVLTKLARLVFLKENSGELEDDGIPGESIRIVSAHPSKRVLVSIEIQFIRNLNVIIDSISKSYVIQKQAGELGLYKVLTMNNYDELAKATFPKLISKFDKLFSQSLSEQNLKVYADLDKAILTTLDDILKKEKDLIESLVTKHFSHTIYLTSRSRQLCVDGFIYNVLVHFVKLVHNIKPLTGDDIFITIINELQTNLLKSVIENMRNVPQDGNYLPMIGNLRLSINFFVEIFAQSESLQLNEYCIKLVEIIFGEIDEAGNPTYSERDFDMILAKNLKESENEFDSFY